MKKLVTLSALLFAACGDDSPGTPDASVQDSGPHDAPPDAPYEKPTPIAVNISATGPDQIFAVAPGPNGSFYAAGHTAATPTGPKYMFVAKLTSAGALDTTFGGGTGFYTANIAALEYKGGTDSIDLAVQSTGKIVVAGTVAHAGDISDTDRDIGLFRVNTDGTLDATFGEVNDGTQIINLTDGAAVVGTTAYIGVDSERSIGIGPNDAIFLHAVARGGTVNDPFDSDTDFAVAKLSEDGLLDTNYGTNGMHLLELDELDGNANVKGLVVLSDGSVIASGYGRGEATKVDGNDTTGTPQPVLYKLDPNGDLVNNFAGTDGVFHEIVLTLQTEIYAFALDGDRITTAGYGRDTGAANVWSIMRFDADDGARSTSFGGATGGVVTLDPTGTLAGANCRNAVGLPGGKTALIGSGGGTGTRDAALAILTQGGELDTTYGTGLHTWDMGGGEDQWWGGAVSGGKLLVGGWKGHAFADQTDTVNDNAHVVIFDLQ